jgi:hypothetical protein
VAVGARRADRLSTLVAQIEAAGGREIAVDLDVLSEASCGAAVSRSCTSSGGLVGEPILRPPDPSSRAVMEVDVP